MTLRVLIKVLIVGAGLAVLSCTIKTIPHVVPVAHEPASALVAGSAKTEITPPVGYPFFGYSLGGKHVSRGVKTRLYARAFYLEDSRGAAVALVQCDLGAISEALHHDVARRVAERTGLGPDGILIAATHTHSGPGAYFGSAFYNDFGSNAVGFDDGLLGFLSRQIADAIDSAFARRRPAKAAVGTCQVDGVTYNRSLAACLANFPELEDTEPADVTQAVNKTLTMLRIDQIGSDRTIPLGAFSNFNIHGTAIGTDNDVYNGDCLAAAERYFEDAVRHEAGDPDNVDIIHALTLGSAGDVAPKFDRTRRGFDEARRIGRIIADSAFSLFESLGSSLSAEIEIEHAYREVSMRHAIYADSAELQPATLGFPVMGGTEDGYTPLHYIWPGAEGSCARASDLTLGPVGVSALLGPFSWRGQDSAKIPGVGGLHGHLLPPESFPQMMTLQVFRLGDLLLLTVPGEMTTEMGKRVIALCESQKTRNTGTRHTMLVAYANQYMSYTTTPEEYNEQHYEGAHTLWGPHMGEFVGTELAELVRALQEDKTYTYPDEWTFTPGSRAKFARFDFPAPRPELVDTVFIDSTLSGLRIVRCYWWDEEPRDCDLRRLDWRIEVPDRNGSWKPLLLPGLGVDSTMAVDSKGLDLMIYCCRNEDALEAKQWMKSHGRHDPEGQRLWCVEWNVEAPGTVRKFRLALLSMEGSTNHSVVGYFQQ